MNDAIQFVIQIAGAAIAILPLAFTVTVIKGTQGIIGSVAGKMEGSGAAKGLRGVGEGIREDRQNTRRTKGLNGEGGLPGYGAAVRFGARRRAAKKSREGGAQYAELNYVANAAAENSGDNKFSKQMAGGDEARQASVVASALAQQKKAALEGVKDMEALIRVRVADPNQTDIKSFEDALKKALETGDTTSAVAAQNLLFGQGGSGVKAFRNTVTAAETGGTADASVIGSLKGNIQENHGKYAKDKGADVLNWANSSSTLANTAVGKMTDNELAGQHVSTLEKMVANNEVTGDQARRMLSDPRVSANLKEDQEALLSQASKAQISQAHDEALKEEARRNGTP